MWEQDVFRIHTDVIQCIDSTTYSSELSDEVNFGDQTKTHQSEIQSIQYLELLFLVLRVGVTS